MARLPEGPPPCLSTYTYAYAVNVASSRFLAVHIIIFMGPYITRLHTCQSALFFELFQDLQTNVRQEQ